MILVIVCQVCSRFLISFIEETRPDQDNKDNGNDLQIKSLSNATDYSEIVEENVSDQKPNVAPRATSRKSAPSWETDYDTSKSNSKSKPNKKYKNGKKNGLKKSVSDPAFENSFDFLPMDFGLARSMDEEEDWKRPSKTTSEPSLKVAFSTNQNRPNHNNTKQSYETSEREPKVHFSFLVPEFFLKCLPQFRFLQNGIVTPLLRTNSTTTIQNIGD